MTPQEAARTWGPFAWGTNDCMTVLADWILTVTGHDPMEDLRGAYGTALECERLTGYLTNPVTAVQKQLDKIGGLPRTTDPQHGDIAVLHVEEGGRFQPVCALRAGTGWIVKGLDGATFLHEEEVRVLAAWEVGYA